MSIGNVKDTDMLPELRLFPELDSRLSNTDKRFTTGRAGLLGYNMVRTYCVSCHKQTGWGSSVDIPVSSICEDCIDKGYRIPIIELTSEGDVLVKPQVEPKWFVCVACHSYMAQCVTERTLEYVCDRCDRKNGELPLEKVKPQASDVVVLRENVSVKSVIELNLERGRV